MFSCCHLVWWLQSPRDSPKQSDFPEISIKPNIESARIPISHSLQLDPVFNHWPYLDQKRVIYPLLVRCLLYFIRFFIYFPIVFLSSVPGRRYRQIAYWSFWMLSENPKISCSLFPCWAVFLHHYGFYTDNYYLQTEVNYLLSLTEKIWTFNSVFQNYFFHLQHL